MSRACGYILDENLAAGGQFSTSRAPSGTVDCVQGELCEALLALGCDDPRLERAFEWMARSVTGEGLAPAGERGAPLRFYAAKCGPGFACGANDGLPCAWGATKVMLAFGTLADGKEDAVDRASHRSGRGVPVQRGPGRGRVPPPRTQTARAATGGSSASRSSTSPTCCRSSRHSCPSATRGDPRLEASLALVRDKQDAQGRWPLEYSYAGKTWVDFGPKKQPNKWVTLRALRVLRAADPGIADRVRHLALSGVSPAAEPPDS